MKISDAFPSKYLKADDLGHHRLNLTVRMVVVEDIADKEYKPVMHFVGKEKGVVLNKTNAGLCAAVWGDETDLWQGKQLELFSQPVMFQGRQVQGIGMAPLMASTAPQAPQAPLSPAAATVADLAADIAQTESDIVKQAPVDPDDIPF